MNARFILSSLLVIQSAAGFGQGSLSELHAKVRAKALDSATLKRESAAAMGCHTEDEGNHPEDFSTQARGASGAMSGPLSGQAVDINPIRKEEREPKYYPLEDRSNAKGFEAVTQDNKKITVAALNDSILLIVFFRPECKFTADILPDLIRLQKTEATKGYRVLPISMSPEGWSGLSRWRKQNLGSIPTEFQVFRPSSDSGHGASVFSDLRVVPTAYLIDERGNIAWRVTGAGRGTLLDKLNLLLLERALKTSSTTPNPHP